MPPWGRVSCLQGTGLPEGRPWPTSAPLAQPLQPTTYPVHDEDLAHVQLLLQEFSCDGYRVEEAESPEGAGEKRVGRSASG